MTRTIGRYGRIGVLAIAAAAYAGTHGSVAVVSSQDRPVCGTKPRSDMEILADAVRVAELKSRGFSRKPGTVITITTYVHVIHDGVEGWLPESTIREQIKVLNRAYEPRGFRFDMAPSTPGNPNPDYSNNAAWFNDAEVSYKTALKEGSGDDLNIYTTSGGGYLGYAYYPTVVGSAYEVLDGLVLAYGTLPGANQPGISDIPGYTYNLGDTGTHEVGHYLGLAHTFEGHCSQYNDGVADTPPERSPYFNCTSGRDTCPDRGGLVLLDPIHNFMDYSDDVCLNTFTGGQAERMNIQWAIYRQGR
jgi:predicted Zn-dependent protease